VNGAELRARARRHLGPHFTRKQAWDSDFPVFVRGHGSYLFDSEGERYLDGLAGLFCVNIGHGRIDIAQAATKQIGTLAYASNWGMAHPPAIVCRPQASQHGPRAWSERCGRMVRGRHEVGQSVVPGKRQPRSWLNPWPI